MQHHFSMGVTSSLVLTSKWGSPCSPFLKRPMLTERRIQVIKATWLHVRRGPSFTRSVVGESVDSIPSSSSNDTNDDSSETTQHADDQSSVGMGVTLIQFYDNFFKTLFKMDPSTRHLFGSDMQKQGRMLFNMVCQLISISVSIPISVPLLE